MRRKESSPIQRLWDEILSATYTDPFSLAAKAPAVACHLARVSRAHDGAGIPCAEKRHTGSIEAGDFRSSSFLEHKKTSKIFISTIAVHHVEAAHIEKATSVTDASKGGSLWLIKRPISCASGGSQHWVGRRAALGPTTVLQSTPIELKLVAARVAFRRLNSSKRHFSLLVGRPSPSHSAIVGRLCTRAAEETDALCANID